MRYARRAFVFIVLACCIAWLSFASVSADPPDPIREKLPFPPVPNAPHEPPVFSKLETATGPLDSADFTAQADSWIGSSAAFRNQNRGGDQLLYVGFDLSSEAERALIYFDLASLPAGAVIDRANMSLQLQGAPGGSVMEVVARRILSSWRENEVTWNNPPSYDNARNWASAFVGANATRYEWDLSDLTRRWASAEFANQGVILVGDETPRVASYDRGFWSREASSSGNRPRMQVLYGIAQIGVLPDFLNVVSPTVEVQWAAGGVTSVSAWDVQNRVKTPTGNYSDWVDWRMDTTRTTQRFEGAHNRIYQFRVRADYRTGGSSGWGPGSEEIWVDLVKPTATFTALPEFSLPDFTVAWSGADDGSGIKDYDFEIYVNDVLFQSFTTTATSQNFTNGLDGQTYAFRVRSRDRAGNVSDWARVQTTVRSPKPIVGINALPPFSPSNFNISWFIVDPLGGIADYQLEIYDNGVLLQTQTTTALSYRFENGVDGHTYGFRVRGRNINNIYSDWTNQVTTKVDALPPTVSLFVAARFQTETGIVVQWSGTDTVSGVISYDIQVREGGGAWNDWLTATSATEGTYFGAIGQTYSFRARARDAVGNLSLYTAEDAMTVRLATAGVGGRVIGNRGLGIATAQVSGTPTALNADARSAGRGNYELFWDTVVTRTVNASHPNYLAPAPITLAPQSGKQSGVDIYLRPSNDVILNGGFELGVSSWTATGGATTNTTGHSGNAGLRLPVGANLSQRVSVPANPRPSVLAFLYRVEAGNGGVLQVIFENLSTAQPPITTIVNFDATPGWRQASIDLTTLPGVQFDLRFALSSGSTGAVIALDEVSLGAAQPTVYYAWLPVMEKRARLRPPATVAEVDAQPAAPAAPLPALVAAPAAIDGRPAIDLSQAGQR